MRADCPVSSGSGPAAYGMEVRHGRKHEHCRQGDGKRGVPRVCCGPHTCGANRAGGQPTDEHDWRCHVRSLSNCCSFVVSHRCFSTTQTNRRSRRAERSASSFLEGDRRNSRTPTTRNTHPPYRYTAVPRPQSCAPRCGCAGAAGVDAPVVARPEDHPARSLAVFTVSESHHVARPRPVASRVRFRIHIPN